MYFQFNATEYIFLQEVLHVENDCANSVDCMRDQRVCAEFYQVCYDGSIRRY